MITATAEANPLEAGLNNADEQHYLQGQYVYDDVLRSIDAAIYLDMVVWDGGVDLPSQLFMPELYSEGGVRQTTLERQTGRWPDLQAYTKYETEQDKKAFKVRGAFMECMLAVQQDPTIRDFVTMSAGNHGLGVTQFVEWHNARRIADGTIRTDEKGVVLFEDDHLLARAHIFCPESASSEKLGPMRRSGAHVYSEGNETLEAAAERAGNFVASRNHAHLVHPFNQPEVMAGQATILLEILQQLREQEVDVRQKPLELYVGGGGFGLANGNAVLLDHLVSLGLVHPDSYVVAVQMERCDAMNRALGRLDRGDYDMASLFAVGEFDKSADGTAVLMPEPENLALAHLLEQNGRLHVMTVSKHDVALAMQRARVDGRRVEPAGALADAGRQVRERDLEPYYHAYPEWRQRVAVAVESGGNVSDDTLDTFSDTHPEPTELRDRAVRHMGRGCLSSATAPFRTKLVEPQSPKRQATAR